MVLVIPRIHHVLRFTKTCWSLNLLSPHRPGIRQLSNSGLRPASVAKDELGAEIKTPKVNVKWFYAVDVPNSKPDWFEYVKEKEPEKFIPFTDHDSSRLEKAYRSLASISRSSQAAPEDDGRKVTVQVTEDRLFAVDLEKFELAPVYWEGPVYEVRRGTWFNSSGIPLSNALSQVIEGGYQAKKPYLFGEDVKESKKNVLSKLSKETVSKFNKSIKEKHKKSSKDRKERECQLQAKLKQQNLQQPQASLQKEEDSPLTIIRDEEPDLLDLQNGTTVLYCDETSAVIFPTSMNSDFELGVIRNFGASSIALISVEKVKRGYTDDMSKTIFDNLPSNPIPDLSEVFHNELSDLFTPDEKSANKGKSKNSENEQQSEDYKPVMESDYGAESSSVPDRQVDHLILCIHGIGQILGHKYESINFTHSINVLRSTMKDVYQNDTRYQKLAYPDFDPESTGKDNEQDKSSYTKNNKIQVLPISWRHKIDFHPARKYESYDENGEYRLPSLSELNVDGVKPLRNILGDVVLDVLLYYEPKYISQIFTVVTEELNRVYSLYKKNNPKFNGKVHLMGHSLGSAIVYDILAGQSNSRVPSPDVTKDLTFDVENLFCVGSPAGIFKLLDRTNIRARSEIDEKDYQPRNKRNPKFTSPKCENLYNIFHPCDPVGYRMEPLVAPRFANLKPEEIPFALKGINTQIRGLADFSDEIQERFSKAASWFSKASTKKKAEPENEEPKSMQQVASEENALGDIVSSLAGGSDKNAQQTKELKKAKLSPEDLKKLTSLNRSGRIDYCLPMGVFDISLLSAISAHVSYFEDKDTAGFIMKEVLASHKDPVDSKSATVYS